MFEPAKVKKIKKPSVILVGTFSDIFLEGLKELEVNFRLWKSSHADSDIVADIIVISQDRSEEAVDFVMKSEAVPIVEVGLNDFDDFDPIEETGNAFLYEQNTPWHMLAAVIRALETNKFAYDWDVLKHAVKDFIAEKTLIVTR
jgi:hypothetical protein